MIFNKIKLFILIATIVCTTSITVFAEDCNQHDSYNKIYNDLIASDIYKEQIEPLNFKYVYFVHRHLNGSSGHRTYAIFTNDYECGSSGIKPTGNVVVWGTGWYDKYHDFSVFQSPSNSYNAYDSYGDVVFSTRDLKDHNGNVFFSAPITQLIQRNLQQMVVVMVSSTKFLVALGIGLMALLIGSLLLRKVFRKFRVV